MTSIALNMRTLALAAMGAMCSISAHAQTSGNETTPSATTPQQAIGAPTPQASAAAIEACTRKAQTMLAALDKGDYTGAEMDFNDTMKAALLPAKLKEVWQSLPQKFGPADPRGAPTSNMSNGYAVINVPMPFQNGNLSAQVACGPDGRVAGFHVSALQPAAASTAAAATTSGD